MIQTPRGLGIAAAVPGASQQPRLERDVHTFIHTCLLLIVDMQPDIFLYNIRPEKHTRGYVSQAARDGAGTSAKAPLEANFSLNPNMSPLVFLSQPWGENGGLSRAARKKGGGTHTHVCLRYPPRKFRRRWRGHGWILGSITFVPNTEALLNDGEHMDGWGNISVNSA